MVKELGAFLCEKGFLTKNQLVTVQAKQAETSSPFCDDIVIEMGMMDELSLAKAKAELYRCSFIDLIETAIDAEAAMLIPEKFARKNVCLPYNAEKGAVRLAMYNPHDFTVIHDVEFSTNARVIPAVATRSSIERAIETAYKVSDSLNSVLKNIEGDADLAMEIEGGEESPDLATAMSEEEKLSQEAPVIKMVNMIVLEAVRKGASDIHIEPQEKYVQVRCRFDGWLKNTMQAPKWMQWPMVSRIKIIAKLDISEKRKPQDGKIRMKVDQREIDLRVSTLPTRHGEKVVIRILDQSKSLVPLDKLGMSEYAQSIIYAAIQRPQGMILVTGPTGSGKTTSLYSFLAAVRDETLNIVTIEDPIEYELKGINQVQINEKAGLTFASALRSILRQDPNIVMVGEIRDGETAEIAVKASQTGHLVFSTLHTNDTVSTITRLIDIGIEPFLIGSSVICILAQRLVRKVCQNCKKPYQPSDWVLHQLKLQQTTDMQFMKGEGCAECGFSGYRGRLGVYEVLSITPKLRERIANRENEEVIKQEAIKGGMQLLIQDGFEKIKMGLTNPDEIIKVVNVEEMATTGFCPRCEKPIQTEFSACPFCGQRLTISCDSCHKRLENDWKSCPFCGTNVNQTSLDELIKRDEQTTVTERPRPPKELSERGLTKPKVLIVDDEPKILLMVKASLKQINCEVITANNGQEGLEMVEKHMPNLVISDVNMPIMNGFELCKALRKNISTAFIPFIMLTSRDTAEDKLIGFQQGTDDYITKPFDYKELQARVQRLLSRTYG